MKLILMTTPHFFVEEHRILTSLFEEGLELLHVRKPETEPVYSERLLSLIPDSFHKQIVVHDHFYLKEEYGLRGVHLNHRNPELPPRYRGRISLSCHTADEIKAHKRKCDYMFLSPIFDSISKSAYPSAFPTTTLRALAADKVIDKKVMALGGINLDNIPQVKALGFGGCVILGDLWNRFNPHSASDFKDLITHFRRLKRACE